jgi:uncharacterized protein Veg
MEFYSATKKNKILSFAGKWVELENIILSEVSKIQKAKSHIFYIIFRVQTQDKYKQYYIYVEILTQHVSKIGTHGGDKEFRNRRKEK